MLYINEGDEIPLDEKFYKIHNLCAILYDQLTEIFSLAEYSKLNRTNFNIDKDKHSDVEKFENREMHALDWLKTNGLNEELSQVVVKHVTIGYFGSICASDFGFIVPGISVQTVPFLPVH